MHTWTVVSLHNSMSKRNPINSEKQGYVVNILVFMLQIYQGFKNWWNTTDIILCQPRKCFTNLEVRLEHSPRKFFARLAYQTKISVTTAWKAKKTSHVRPYKIRQVQVTEDYCFLSTDDGAFRASKQTARDSGISVVRFQVPTATDMKFRVFWDVAPCSQVDVDRRFRGTYCLYHHSSPWWWRQYAYLKRRSTSTSLHGATFQKTLNFRCFGISANNL
jgi:hypothetical protein